AKEISLGLFLKRGLKHSCASAANTLQVTEAKRVCVAGRVLVNSDESGDPAAFSEHLAHAMARGLGSSHAYVNARRRKNGLEMDIEPICSHAYVNARRRKNGLEMDIEPMRKHQQLSRSQVRSHFLGVQLGLGLIGNKHHDHIGPLGGVGNCVHFKAGFLRLGNGLGSRGQADFYLNTRVLEVKSMGMPL